MDDYCSQVCNKIKIIIIIIWMSLTSLHPYFSADTWGDSLLYNFQKIEFLT